MNSTLKYDFCEISIFDNFIIAVINEGEILKPEHNEILVDIAEKYFKNRPFAYISNRIHSHSVDPQIYLKTSKISNLVAFAVVSQDELTRSLTSIEKIFLSVPLKSFTGLSDAIKWCEYKIEKAPLKTTLNQTKESN